MNPVDYTRAGGRDQLATALSPTVRPLAGGTDLIPRLKLGLDQPATVVDLKTSDLGRSIERTDAGWRLDALVTLSQIERHPDLGRELPALVHAVGQAATPQLRNRATIAGNLLQRPRCWYFRQEHVRCWLSGGEGCPAREGRNEHHAIVDTGPCVAVHPSDAATALVALGAGVTVLDGRGQRDLAVAELLAPATDERRMEHVLDPDAVITAVTVPAAAPRSVYLKAMDRAAWAFALVGVAATLERAPDGSVAEVRLVASGVAGVPWPLTAAAASLTGAGLGPADIDRAAALAAEGTTPLAHNGYKVPLLQALVRRALTDLAGGAPANRVGQGPITG